MDKQSTKVGNLEIFWKQYLSRGVRKQMKACMMSNISMNTGKMEEFSFDISKEEEAKDILILGMVESISQDGKPVELTLGFLDSLENSIWEKIYKEAEQKANPKEDPKG